MLQKESTFCWSGAQKSIIFINQNSDSVGIFYLRKRPSCLARLVLTDIFAVGWTVQIIKLLIHYAFSSFHSSPLGF
jgi:hypothetical protein